jgi:hypothetical protein
MKSAGFQQHAQGMTHGFMIVYDDDNRICVHGCSLQYRGVKKSERADEMSGEILPLVSCRAGGWAKRMEQGARVGRAYPAGRRN